MADVVHRFVCVGGEVRSRNDGQRHYVQANQLPELYGVPREHCVFVDRAMMRSLRAVTLFEPGVVVLHPDPTGKYVVPPALGKERAGELQAAFRAGGKGARRSGEGSQDTR